MQLFTNNASSRLVAGISNVSLSMQIAAGDGMKFPNPTGGDFFLVTLSKISSGIETAVEIVKVTARATDVFTIVRAQEGTTAIAFLEADWVQLRMTAASATAAEAHYANVSNPHAVTKAQVGLSNVDNTSDTAKPVSTAQATALALKAPLASPTFTGTVAGITAAMVGLGSVDNTADTAKPVSTAQATAIALKQDSSAKDASGGFAGLTLFKLNLKNAANTFTNFFTNATTAARTWTLPDKDGTVAMTSDITGTNSGTNTGDNAVNTTYASDYRAANFVARTNYGEPTTALATGLLKNTTTTGAHTIAVAGTDYVAPSGLGTGVATFLATPSSSNLAAAITDETGSGSAVFGTSPTIATPTINGYTEGIVTANSSTTYTFSLASATCFAITLTGNCTYTFPTAVAGKSFTLYQIQDATGSRTVTWPGTVKWPAATAPTITSTASKADKLTFTCFDGTNWVGSVAGSNY